MPYRPAAHHSSVLPAVPLACYLVLRAVHCQHEERHGRNALSVSTDPRLTHPTDPNSQSGARREES